MAVDKLVDSTQLDTDLTSVANAIRAKGGTSAQMAFPTGFVSAVQAIPTGQPVSFELIAQINVTEPVYLIRQVLPESAVEYGIIHVELDLTFNKSDYLYVALTPHGGGPSDDNGYMSPASNIDKDLWPAVLNPSKYGEEYSEKNVYVYTAGLNIMRVRAYTDGTEITDFCCKLYTSESRITSGTIKIYGVVS